jgi:hypothetical protein
MGRITKKLALMLEAYKGEAKLNVTEAARLAGYGCPKAVGARIRRQHRELFDRAEVEMKEALVMGGRELDERITNLARNEDHKDHYKALELLAKIHGKLSEKVDITIKKGSLDTSLDSLLLVMLQARAKQQSLPADVIDVALPQLQSTNPTEDDTNPSKQPS